MEEEFTRHRRKGMAEMRPYKPGEDLSRITVSQEDQPEEGGKIARNPDNHDDQWYVSKQYYKDNFEPA